jgi:hypothetical protein
MQAALKIGSDAGLKRRAGAPRGNTNALKHGRCTASARLARSLAWRGAAIRDRKENFSPNNSDNFVAQRTVETTAAAPENFSPNNSTILLRERPAGAVRRKAIAMR